MSGKDLIDSVRLSGRICRILGGAPPAGFTYELFLDENGEKISKSRGNGLTVDEWLDYAPASSLGLYMYNAPRKAKRLYFDVIPRHVDDWARHLESFADQDWAGRVENPYLASSRHPAARRRRQARGRAPFETGDPGRRRARCRRRGGWRAEPGRVRVGCSTSPRSATPRIRRCCGASSAATRRERAPRTTPVSMR